jgi:ribosomal protein L11
MKKVNLDQMLGKRTRCRYKKNIPKTIIVRANLPVGAATKSPPLGSILGQYGLDASDFCNYFNVNSAPLWESSTIIPIVIFISPVKTYLIEYKLPTVYSLFDKALAFRARPKGFFRKPSNRKLLVATAYKIALIKAQTSNPHFLQLWLRQILCSSNSYNLYNHFQFFKAKFNYRKKKK